MSLDGVAFSGAGGQAGHRHARQALEVAVGLLGTVQRASHHQFLSAEALDGRFEQVEVKLEVGIESADQDVLGALFEAPFGILEDDVLFGSAVDEMALPGTEGDDDRQIGRCKTAPDGSG